MEGDLGWRRLDLDMETALWKFGEMWSLLEMLMLCSFSQSVNVPILLLRVRSRILQVIHRYDLSENATLFMRYSDVLVNLTSRHLQW